MRRKTAVLEIAILDRSHPLPRRLPAHARPGGEGFRELLPTESVVKDEDMERVHHVLEDLEPVAVEDLSASETVRSAVGDDGAVAFFEYVEPGMRASDREDPCRRRPGRGVLRGRDNRAGYEPGPCTGRVLESGSQG
jgi:hypothetical protein